MIRKRDKKIRWRDKKRREMGKTNKQETRKKKNGL